MFIYYELFIGSARMKWTSSFAGISNAWCMVHCPSRALFSLRWINFTPDKCCAQVVLDYFARAPLSHVLRSPTP
ncbi:hypothetical protein A0H81_03267 [Grifola frondosa]|uniref:Uncharacterized protein n=1 Tax=Grifola frondosa TaxID=5627 RepID=A0A1C7MIC3_GRIFR|nr:hypothetical protein A0H81_03267 [Grifola frondosa]